MHLPRYLPLALVAAALASGSLLSSPPVETSPDLLIGYTELRTNLPGGRYVNVWTMRAAVVKADGTGRRVLAEELTNEQGTWTQFNGWSPDGKIALFSRAWKSAESGQWEEQHKTFRFSKDGYHCDGYLFDLASGRATNVTAVERVSHANEYLQFWRGDETKLSFGALIDGVSRPFLMDRDGKNKRELIRRDDKPWIALGSPGGHTIVQTVPQIVMNMIDFHMDVQQAIAAPRLSFVQPDITAVDQGVPESVRHALTKLDHNVQVRRLGNAHGLTVEYDKKGRPARFTGAADPRGEGQARGR